MTTVTYKNQPAIHRTGGHIYSGTKYPYTVKSILWPKQVELWITQRLIGKTLHVCCGKSKLGDCRVDLNEIQVNIRADAASLPFKAQSWDTVLIDPPYNGIFRWNHNMLAELARIARLRIIFQHWFMPIDNKGRFKKSHRFQVADLAIWQPKTYFGRAQVITVMDNCLKKAIEPIDNLPLFQEQPQ